MKSSYNSPKEMTLTRLALTNHEGNYQGNLEPSLLQKKSFEWHLLSVESHLLYSYLFYNCNYACKSPLSSCVLQTPTANTHVD